MLDSNIFDKIIVDDELKARILELKSRGLLRILTTHIQIDELNDTSDESKREKLVECAEEVCERIPTMGVVVGVSRFDMARLSNGEEIETIRQGNREKMTQDALIAATANSDADFLVTNDDKLYRRVRNNLTNIRVLSFDEFVEEINKLSEK